MGSLELSGWMRWAELTPNKNKIKGHGEKKGEFKALGEGFQESGSELWQAGPELLKC
jgi:hypothetical protein